MLGEPLQGSPRHASIELPAGGPGTAQFIHKQTRDRDRRPSETVNIDLSRVIEEDDDTVAAADTSASASNGSPPGCKHSPQPIQLGKGKWSGGVLLPKEREGSPSPLAADEIGLGISPGPPSQRLVEQTRHVYAATAPHRALRHR